MPSTGPSSGRSRGSARTSPPCASVRRTARSTPFSRGFIRVASNGHAPFCVWRAPAGRALVRLPVDALLEEEQLDAPVRRGLERLLPARRRTAAASRLFLPAVEHRRLLREPRLLEERLREREQLRRRRVALARGRPDEAVARLGRELVDERRPRLVRPDDDDMPGETAANVVVEILGDRAQMLSRELVDVPLVARLRPAALVVPSRLLLGQVGQRLEPPARQLEEEAALAVDHGDDRALAAPDERHERRDREVRPDADDVVRHALAERVRAPEPVEPGREERDALHAVRSKSFAKKSRIRSKSD